MIALPFFVQRVFCAGRRNKGGAWPRTVRPRPGMHREQDQCTFWSIALDRVGS